MSKLRANHPELELMPIDRLRVPKRALRKVSERHIERVVASIGEFGFVGAIVVEADLTVLTGQVRLEAARRLGFSELPVIRVDHLTPAQVKAYRIADNKLAEGVAWDTDALRLEFEEILILDSDYELELTGFSTGELDLVLDPSDRTDPADESEIVPAAFAITRIGDIWQIGPHRLICGDTKDPQTWQRLMQGRQARLVVTDPPYNVAIDSIMGLGATRYREFAEASGEMSADQFEQFLATSLSAMSEHLVAGGLIYSFMDWKHIETLLSAGRSQGYDLFNVAVWNKMKGGMGSFYRSAHELCAIFKKPGAAHINNIELGRHGRNRTNVWDVPGFSSFGRNRDKSLADHPTVKPVELIVDIIKDASRRDYIVVDGFCGSGTTLIAAQKSGRVAYCAELDPLYVDVALRRFEERFGIKAIHAQTGLDLAALRDQREAGEASCEEMPLSDPIPQAGRSPVVSLTAPASPMGALPDAPRRRRRPPSWVIAQSAKVVGSEGGRA
ncbi:site-specific DNA-methyltransferase [Aminobacter sp. Piv2-1]|uniref:site-specific DNA-methyltransferase n=1 Tax=Aminobacter sp. Piv2-1 TaxID=3031122 RepID=UPI00309F3730